jgi:tryptophan synthase alpha chain
VRLAPPVVSIYLMAGRDLVPRAQAAVAAGAGLLEVGIPFSDPLADGPTVQRAGQAALADGMTMPRALALVAELRTTVDVPLVPMTYAGPVMAYGERRFCADAAAAGAAGVIVPDVPADEAGELAEGCADHGLDLVPLLAPTSTDARIALACERAGGFVYLVSVAGTTGARASLSDRVEPLVRRVRAHTGLPLLVGFGISAPDHVRAVLAAGADGVVVGSRAIEVADEGGPAALGRFVASLVEAAA